MEISTWCEMKWVRGLAHLNDLQDRMLLWDAAGHVWADLTLDDTRKHVGSVLRVDALPPLSEMSLLLGDAVHNMRSSLDGLAWELCHLEGKSPAHPKQIYFPAAMNEAEWRKAAANLASMPPSYLERIRQAQPYLATPPTSALVAVLAGMSNRDKHRGMIAATATANTFAIELSIEQEDLGQSTPEGTIDGFDVKPMSDDVRLLRDGNPYLSLDTSTRITLTRSRVPVQLGYTVDVDEVDYDLGQVISALHQVHALIYSVCNLAPAS